MTDKYYAYIEAINQRDHAILILSLAGVALGVGWLLLDALTLPDTTKRVAKWAYALSCFSLYALTVAVGIANA